MTFECELCECLEFDFGARKSCNCTSNYSRNYNCNSQRELQVANILGASCFSGGNRPSRLIFVLITGVGRGCRRCIPLGNSRKQTCGQEQQTGNQKATITVKARPTGEKSKNYRKSSTRNATMEYRVMRHYFIIIKI